MIVWIDAVVPDRRRDDLTRRQARPIMHGHDPDAVNEHRLARRKLIFRGNRCADHNRIEPTDIVQFLLPSDNRRQFLPPSHFQPINAILRDDDEQSEINGINAFTEDDPLPPALPDGRLRRIRIAQEFPRILKMIAIHNPPQRLARRQRFPVPRICIPNLSLRHDHQRDLVNPILPRPIEKMNTTTEQISLITRLAIESDDSAIRNRSLTGPFLLDDSDAVVGDGSDDKHVDKDKRDDRADDPPNRRWDGQCFGHIRQGMRGGQEIKRRHTDLPLNYDAN